MDGFRSRLSEIDLVDRLALPLPVLLVQLLLGLVFFIGALVVRAGVDAIAFSAGPFALIYPAIMLATLYGRWQAGVATWFVSYLHAWYFILPLHQSFEFSDPADFARTLVNGGSALVILFFAEIFRRGVSRATAERDIELQTRDMLLQELDHRTKNNFAMVASLLDLQRRTSESPAVSEALALASVRVQSFAQIHGSIYSKGSFSDTVEMEDYFRRLADELATAFFPDQRIAINVACDPVEIPRDQAVAFGLIVNEAVTNAAKHAFPENETGRIGIAFKAPQGEPWVLTIVDDGRGTGSAPKVSVPGRGGLGSKLMEAFAKKAGGTLETITSAAGTTVRLAETV